MGKGTYLTFGDGLKTAHNKNAPQVIHPANVITKRNDCVSHPPTHSLFGWLVADGWCWFVLREEYCWLVAGGWFVLREKYCRLVADKPSEQAVSSFSSAFS
jgi:hypothetical protein